MASTRNRNTPGNYSLEQREYKQFENYTLYPNSQYGAGLTKLVELIPNKKDSVSAALYDNLLPGICAGNNPFPGNLVLYAAPY